VAQQPNIELDPAQRPRRMPEPAPPRRWTPALRPGMITSPSEKPEGGTFGTPGPDTGYALRVLHEVEGEIDENVAAVLVSLMSARSGALGRAPIKEDLEVAKLLAGMREGLPAALTDRMKRWTEAVAHERWSNRGRLAVAEVPREQLVMKPDELRGYLTNHL
jgi:hypothetical protein